MRRYNALLTFVIALLSISFVFMPCAYAEEVDTPLEETTESLEDKTTLDETENTLDDSSNEAEGDLEEVEYESHKVAVIVTKVDEEDNPLVGATLQILDSEGIVVDEWVSDGLEHEALLPEGTYTLHEVEAPEGYELAEDQEFTVEVVLNEINAITEHDTEICEHHHGIPLYYVESKGELQEVYCINQNWDEPNNVSYDGSVVTVDNITTFTPDYDKTMSNQELYDKVLDVVYHRSKVNEDYPGEYSEVEIRYITEMALKNYTSADVESQNGKDKDGNPIMIKFMRYYSIDLTKNSKYSDTPGEGDAIGNLAKHWWIYHKDENNKRMAIPDKYITLYYYLVRDEEHHPEDMHLYVYSTQTPGSDDPYQNLIGITWFNPYDEDHKVSLNMVDNYSDEVTDVTITKIWDDNSNQDGIRPESIDVTLSNGDTVTLNEENNWTASVKDLPVYDKGNKITYTWSEVSTSGYELVSNETKDYVTTLTNRHTPETVEITINKTWDDYDDISKIRPSEIVVSVLANGEVIETYTIASQDNWTMTLSDLPKYIDGKEIKYTVKEEEIPEYETYYEEDGYIFTIINHHELGKGNGPEEEEELPPQTGIGYDSNRNSIIYLVLVMFNILGLSIRIIKNY